PGVQVYGGTSMLSVMTKDGIHVGETGSLSMLAVSSPKIVFGVGGADVDEIPSAREAGRAAIRTAIKNAGKEGEIPKLVLMTGSVGNEEELLLGIEDVVGKEVPIIGGSAGDNDLSGAWRQFANDKTYSNGIALTAVYTDLRVGWAYEAGYLRSEKEGTITRAEGRVIYEINNRPAAEVYNEWTGGVVSEELKTGGTVLSKTSFYPLAKVIHKGEDVYYLSIHPLSINLPEKSLTVFTNVEEGDRILLMHGTWELLLNRAQTTSHKAMISGGIEKGEAVFGIYTFCAGTMLAIPEDERPKMPLLVKNELGGAPFIGTFTFGEQGPLGEGNHHGNLINSMIVFAE
ncbi:MAG: FIST signal transduction protein, partial [Candidatus Aenigmatarchaeota archaeon]